MVLVEKHTLKWPFDGDAYDGEGDDDVDDAAGGAVHSHLKVSEQTEGRQIEKRTPGRLPPYKIIIVITTIILILILIFFERVDKFIVQSNNNNNSNKLQGFETVSHGSRHRSNHTQKNIPSIVAGHQFLQFG